MIDKNIVRDNAVRPSSRQAPAKPVRVSAPLRRAKPTPKPERA